MDPVQFSLCQKWTRSSFRSAKSGPGPVFAAKSGPGPVFALPKVDPVQFSLCQKWTRSSFHFANGGPGPVFAQPKVDLSSFRSTKSGPGSSGVLWNKSGLPIQIAFSDYDIKQYVFIVLLQHDKLLAAIYLSVLFEPLPPSLHALVMISIFTLAYTCSGYSHTGVGFCMLVAEMGLLFQP